MNMGVFKNECVCSMELMQTGGVEEEYPMVTSGSNVIGIFCKGLFLYCRKSGNATDSVYCTTTE